MWKGEKLWNAMVVPVEGIEPPLLAEHDFESCAYCYNYLIFMILFGTILWMCKRLCKFSAFSYAF
jgi:hypothetical protein